MQSVGSYLQPSGATVMKNYQHASRLYVDGAYALSPKTSWIYYVVFDIDPAAVGDKKWSGQQKTTEVGLLVKNVELPKFQIATEVVNQYNRKTIIQKNITYQTVSFSLHDDNSNVVHNLWLNYFKYYYNDSNLGGTGPVGTARDNPTGAFSNNKYDPSTDLFTPTNYGLNSGNVQDPFFRSITIYQLNRQLFTSYQLVNPIVKSWEHDKLDQTQGTKLAESKLSIDYETVFYGEGQVKKDEPTGFAVFHYDNDYSPLSVGGVSANGSEVTGLGGSVNNGSGAFGLYGDASNTFNSNSINPSNSFNSALSRNPSNLLSNVFGVRSPVSNANGYSTLDSVTGIAQTTLNGLGVNLNLNLGNNQSISNQSLARQVSVLTGSGQPQDIITGILSQSPLINGVPPTSSDPNIIAGDFLSSLQSSDNSIIGSAFTQSTEDIAPYGSTIASGNYFNPVVPLEDSSPYIASSNIDVNSDPVDVQTALNDLNTSWSNDNDFVASQALNPSDVQSQLDLASSPEEYTAIQNEANYSYVAVESLQTTVDSKYSSEYQRLTTIQTTQQTDTSGSPYLSPDDILNA